MLFFKKKETENSSEKTIESMTVAQQSIINNTSVLADFISVQIDSLFIKELKTASGLLSLNSNTIDLIYSSIVFAMDCPVVNQGTDFYKAALLVLIIGKNHAIPSNFKPVLTINDVDKDLDVSFFQLMTRIYSSFNKEFSEKELEKYNKLSENYRLICTSLVRGFQKANASQNEIRLKAKQIRKNYSEQQYGMLVALVALMGK